jgi:transcriptional regulator with XRE-family HTH domain
MRKHSASIGESIRARRIALRLSQRDLARAAGTTAASVSHIERGVRKLSAGLLARIAGALQCPTDLLLSGAADPSEGSPLLRQVVAAMKAFPPPLQREVADFCEYLKHRRRRRWK